MAVSMVERDLPGATLPRSRQERYRPPTAVPACIGSIATS